jgi:hypothetical protein
MRSGTFPSIAYFILSSTCQVFIFVMISLKSESLLKICKFIFLKNNGSQLME